MRQIRSGRRDSSSREVNCCNISTCRLCINLCYTIRARCSATTTSSNCSPDAMSAQIKSAGTAGTSSNSRRMRMSISNLSIVTKPSRGSRSWIIRSWILSTRRRCLPLSISCWLRRIKKNQAVNLYPILIIGWSERISWRWRRRSITIMMRAGS